MRPWTELAKLIILNSAKYIDKNLSRQLMRDEGALTASLSQPVIPEKVQEKWFCLDEQVSLPH